MEKTESYLELLYWSGTFYEQGIRYVVFNMEKITNIGTCSPQDIFTLTIMMSFILSNLAMQKVNVLLFLCCYETISNQIINESMAKT